MQPPKSDIPNRHYGRNRVALKHFETSTVTYKIQEHSLLSHYEEEKKLFVLSHIIYILLWIGKCCLEK